MSQPITRRQALAGAATALGAAAIGACTPTPITARKKETDGVRDPRVHDPFGYCFNTSTIRGQKLSLVEEIDVAAKAVALVLAVLGAGFSVFADSIPGVVLGLLILAIGVRRLLGGRTS